jgi:hypothetical protein
LAQAALPDVAQGGNTVMVSEIRRLLPKIARLEPANIKQERGITGKQPEPGATMPRCPRQTPRQTEEALMWLSLFAIVLVMSLGFGLGSMLADMFERDSSY